MSDSCYCVCHTPMASNAYCEHCKGDNEVGRHYKKLSVVANAIGYEMLRHDGRPTREIQGVDGIDVSEEEAARCRRAAIRVLDHLEKCKTDLGGEGS